MSAIDINKLSYLRRRLGDLHVSNPDASGSLLRARLAQQGYLFFRTLFDEEMLNVARRRAIALAARSGYVVTGSHLDHPMVNPRLDRKRAAREVNDFAQRWSELP